MPRTDTLYAIVKFNSFFTDMLRYDRCTPHTEIDSSEIERSHNEGVLGPFFVIVQKECEVRGKQYLDEYVRGFTLRRWEPRGNEILHIDNSPFKCEERFFDFAGRVYGDPS